MWLAWRHDHAFLERTLLKWQDALVLRFGCPRLILLATCPCQTAWNPWNSSRGCDQRHLARCSDERCSTSHFGRAGRSKSSRIALLSPWVMLRDTCQISMACTSWWARHGCSCHCCYARSQWFVRIEVVLISKPALCRTRETGCVSRRVVNSLPLGTFTAMQSDQQPTLNQRTPHHTTHIPSTPSKGSAKASHYGTDNVPCREMHYGDARC
jgi:hypothetical protein